MMAIAQKFDAMAFNLFVHDLHVVLINLYFYMINQSIDFHTVRL